MFLQIDLIEFPITKIQFQMELNYLFYFIYFINCVITVWILFISFSLEKKCFIYVHFHCVNAVNLGGKKEFFYPFINIITMFIILPVLACLFSLFYVCNLQSFQMFIQFPYTSFHKYK